MKNLMGTLFATVIAGLILWIVQTDKPEVVYSISENVLLSDSDKIENSVQQIHVRNIGDALASEIQVKVDKQIINYRLIKNFNTDQVHIYQEDRFEVLYEELVPDGSFVIVLELSDSGLMYEDLVVSSSNGIAKNLLESQENKLASTLIMVMLLLIYFVVILNASRKMLVDTIHTRYSNSKYEDLSFIYKKKPFYLKEKEWNSLIIKFLEFKLSNSYLTTFTEINENDALKILKLTSKPDCLSEDDFNRIQKLAFTTFKVIIKVKVISYKYSKITDLKTIYTDALNLINQANVGNDELTEVLSNSYLEVLVSNIRTYSLEELDKLIGTAKPEFMKDVDWSRYINHVENEKYKIICDYINKKSIYRNELVKLLSQVNDATYNLIYYNLLYMKIEESIFPFGEIKYIDEEWVKEQDRKILSEIVEKFKKVKLDLVDLDNKIKIIRNLINKKEFNKESCKTYFGNNELEILESYYQSITNIKDTEKIIKEEMENLWRDKDYTNELKIKVTDQLNLIHALFDNPIEVLRTEPYNNPFNEQNFELIRTLAKDKLD